MQNEKAIIRDPASFRDPVNRVYAGEDMILREIYPQYFDEYNHFTEKLYPELLKADLIIPHKELSRDKERILISAEKVDLISYPYEWNFYQLKAAALATLDINIRALKYGMILKDASAYNIQFYKDNWRLIDTCSFMFYEETPWVAYSQFLRHFVAPLVLIKHCNPLENRLSQIYLDGIPIPYAARRLPWYTHLAPSYWIHLYSQSWADLFRTTRTRIPHMPYLNLVMFLGNLYKFVESLKYKPLLDRGWLKYGEAGSYNEVALRSKKAIVKLLLNEIPGAQVRRILDLGANTGVYSRMASYKGFEVISVDSDHDCMYYLDHKPFIFPLVVDLCNPPPAIGWANRERRSFWDRIGKVDCIMALALIHHLSIRNNVPLGMVAELLADHCQSLIIEWIPPDDKQAIKLLGVKNIPEYNLATFIDEFGRYFKIKTWYPIEDSKRKIYYMERLSK